VGPAPMAAAGPTCSQSEMLTVLPDSAHCHNFAGTRALLWDRLADWTDGVIRRRTEA